MESGATTLDSGEQVRVALPLSFLFQRRRYQRSQHSMETTDDELHPGLQASTDTRIPHPLKTSLESQRLATETTQGPGFRDCVPAVPPSPSLRSPYCCMPAESGPCTGLCCLSLCCPHANRRLCFQLGTPALSQLHTSEALRCSGNCFWKLGHRW